MPNTVYLSEYDLIAVSTSGGKDSSAMAWEVAAQAEAEGVRDRLVLIHATFPEEWPGTLEIVQAQAEQLGLPLEIVSRGESLLDYVRRRGMWPSSQARYCTSEFKRAPIEKAIRRLAPRGRVLNCLGIRAQESPARAKKPAFERNRRSSNSRRTVDNWFPIFSLSTEEVWAIIRANRIPTHPAYAKGFDRLACRFCIFANKETLLAAAYEHPELFAEYLQVERDTGHKFRPDVPLESIQAARTSGQKPVGVLSFDCQL